MDTPRVEVDQEDAKKLKRFETATRIKKRCRERFEAKIDDPASTDSEILDSFSDVKNAHQLRHSIWLSFDEKQRPEF